MSNKNSGSKPENAGLEPDQGAAQGNGGQGTGTPAQKMGLERFLQKSPRPSGITALLRIKHKAGVKTTEEWEAAVNELLKKKAQ